jgi:hypothetical protein
MPSSTMLKYASKTCFYLQCSVINDYDREQSEPSNKELYLQISASSLFWTKGINNSNIGICLKCTVQQIIAFVAVLCKASAEVESVVSGHSFGLVLCRIALKPRP